MLKPSTSGSPVINCRLLLGLGHWGSHWVVEYYVVWYVKFYYNDKCCRHLHSS